MRSKIATIIFLSGMTGLGFSYAMLMRVKGDQWDQKKKLLGILVLVFLVLIVVGWIYREYEIKDNEKDNEKFDSEENLQKYYNQFDQKGQRLIAGAVFTDYPPEVPGLGWVL